MYKNSPNCIKVLLLARDGVNVVKGHSILERMRR